MKVQALFITAMLPAGATASEANACCVVAQTGCHAITEGAHCQSHGYACVATLGAIGHLTSPTAKASKFTEPNAAKPHRCSVRNAAKTIGSGTTSAEVVWLQTTKTRNLYYKRNKDNHTMKNFTFLGIYVVDDKIVLKH